MAKNANMIEFLDDFDHISKLQLVIPSWHAFFTVQGKFQTNMTLATLTKKIKQETTSGFSTFHEREGSKFMFTKI
jgi:hypothetical protein